MGLFSFIKNAGAKIFGVGKPSAKEMAAEAEAKELRREEAAAARLEETINDLQLVVQDLNIHIEGHIIF